ncbi:MAG: LytTR family DNA-binding domain-containing protein [Lachnospiraceae bacterium]|nr:LytTR family DNA-binding domain-containing protein [Lachnospiraceae bacterium]
MAYHIAVCDDNPTDQEYILSLLKEWSLLRNLPIESEAFPSSESFLFRYAENKTFDLLLLDVEMKAMDGVELAQRIRRENKTVQIVFITGYSDYIAEGYEVEALHYLMKPLDKEKLFRVLDRAVEKNKQQERCLNLMISGEMVRIPLYEIRYLEVHHNNVTIATPQRDAVSNPQKEYTVRRTLADFEKELDESFFRVGRGMILNLKHISRVTKKDVLLFDGTRLPLPRGAYEALNRAIIERG